MNELAALAAGLRSAGFEGTFETDAAAGVVYGTDNSVYQLRPVGALVPTCTDDLVAIAAVNASLPAPFDLVARGGGTGTNGQSLTNGLVVDTRRSMNRIVSIDADALEAVVQPGVVLGELNAALAPHGVFFAPHVSTSSRATIGGMVSTDAAGKGSLVHGRTNRHVLGIDAVLPDGTPWHFGQVERAEMEALAARPNRIGDLHRQVAAAVDGLPADAFPEVPRGFSGYNLADAATADGIDFTKVLCGSEGTLALLGEIRVRLTPLPNDPRLAVIAYADFDAAVRDSNRLKATQPIAIECLDERTISLASASPAWPALAELLGPSFAGGSLLLMEFDGDAGVDALRDAVGDGDVHAAFATTTDPTVIAAVWKVRADAVGLLGQAVDGRRSIAFVEDCAVPPVHLEAFVRGYRDILDAHGLSYGMFGHADVGCVHVRPALDLYDAAHERLLRAISDQVAELVGGFGGVLWGEHGRGFRGEYLDLASDVVDRMRLVKTAFDPNNIMNPGKLYAPIEGDEPIKRIDEVPLRVHTDRTVAVPLRDEFDSAFSCNGNGICHHWGAAEVMCPSYKVTADPRLSPKGRADLVRAWLADPNDAELVAEVADSMAKCLSCGACTGRCPVQVDIPEMKSRFLERHPETGVRRRARMALLGRFEALLPVVQRGARVVAPLQRLAAPALARLLHVVDLPTVPGGTLAQRLAELGVPLIDDPAERDGVGDVTVVIVPDAFTAFIDPDVLVATLRVMQALGERPAVAPFVPSGKFDHVTGRRRRFTAAVARQRALVERLGRTGAELVVIEPAVSLLAQHEYVAIDSSFPAGSTTALADFVAERLDRLPTPRRPGASNRVAQLFGHCTEVSLAPERAAAYRAMLEAAGYDVTVEATSCCGMAGVFGHEAESMEMSSALFDRDWRPRLDADGPVVRCAAGYSCRSQAKRFGYDEMRHPVQVLADAIARS